VGKSATAAEPFTDMAERLVDGIRAYERATLYRPASLPVAIAGRDMATLPDRLAGRRDKVFYSLTDTRVSRAILPVTVKAAE